LGIPLLGPGFQLFRGGGSSLVWLGPSAGDKGYNKNSRKKKSESTDHSNPDASLSHPLLAERELKIPVLRRAEDTIGLNIQLADRILRKSKGAG